MTRSSNLTFGLLWLLASTITCSDPSTSLTSQALPRELPRELPKEFEAIVSDPMSIEQAGIDAAEPLVGANASEPSVSAKVVYLSLRPQTIPRGRTLHVKHLGTGNERTANLVDGGLDPIAVVASVGDTLSLVATDSSGATKATTMIVSAPHSPRVVRTIPPRRKRDVPLNLRIAVVFSEPIAPTALTVDAVRLLQGDAMVSGELQLQPDQLTVTFTPSTDLAPSTDYQLFITRSIVDGQGEALDSAMTVEFRTIDPPSGSLMISTVTAGTDLDPDGYYLASMPPDHRSGLPRVGLNELRGVSMSPGTYDVWLADVDPNCSVGNDSLTVSIQSGQTTSIALAVSCTPRTDQAASPLAGVFEMVGWEFFRDSAFTDRYESFFDGSVEDGGRLMFRSVGDGAYRWQWTAGIAQWQKNSSLDWPLVLTGGVATLEGSTLTAARTRDLWLAECDLGDCGGPLHGNEAGAYAVVRNVDELIISGPTDCYFTEVGSSGSATLYNCKPAWTRMTLRKVR